MGFDTVHVRHPGQEGQGEDGQDHEQDEHLVQAQGVYHGPRHAGEHQLAHHLHGGQERVVRGLDVGLRRLGQRHHGGERGRGDETCTEVAQAEADDAEVEHDAVKVDIVKTVTDGLSSPCDYDDVLY